MAKQIKNSASMANVKATEAAAISAVKAIGGSRAAAASAMLAFVLACCDNKATPAVFDAGLSRIVDAAEGADVITVKGYASNARRIFACPADKLAEARKAGSHIKTVSDACPAVQKAKSGAKAGNTHGKKDGIVKPAATDPAPVKVSTPATDPLLALQNDLLACRKAFGNKRAMLALIGEMEDMLGDLKKMAA